MVTARLVIVKGEESPLRCKLHIGGARRPDPGEGTAVR